MHPISALASRLKWLALAAFIALAMAGPCLAQSDNGIYAVGDVAVDITADSAVHARDQALAQAQRDALKQLLERLSVDQSLMTKADDDTVAALVQNFEVQNERSSAVRYIGTFTVQFRPNAVREWLAKNNASFSETASKPVIVLPVLNSDGHPVLWERRTKWWTAWENVHGGGLVPIIMPAGGLEDNSTIGTEQAVSGDTDAIKALIDKYQVDGAVVAQLDTDPDKPGSEIRVDVFRYDADGKPADPVHLSLPAPGNKAALDAALVEAVREVRRGLEGNWKQSLVKTAAPVSASPGPAAPSAAAIDATAARIDVTVPINSLAEWELIKRKLGSIPTIEDSRIVTMTRTTAVIDLGFRGTTEQLENDLARQQLALTRDSINETWIMQLSAASHPM
jgi:hypothetical protein